MQTNQKLIAGAVAALLAYALGAQSAFANDVDKEKCFGVAKVGKNDCAANGHACAGQAKRNKDANEWVYLPTGTCERLINGSLKPRSAAR